MKPFAIMASRQILNLVIHQVHSFALNVQDPRSRFVHNSTRSPVFEQIVVDVYSMFGVKY